jgi:hypothetical protein
MLKDKQTIKSWFSTAHIFHGLTSGNTFSELPHQLYDGPSKEALSNNIIAWHKVNESYYYMDSESWDKAEEILLEIHEYGSNAIKNSILSDLLFLYIRRDNSSPEIEGIYKKIEKMLNRNKYDFHLIRARLAYSVYKDRSEQNKGKVIAQIEKVIKTYPYKGEALFCKRMIEKIML